MAVGCWAGAELRTAASLDPGGAELKIVFSLEPPTPPVGAASRRLPSANARVETVARLLGRLGIGSSAATARDGAPTCAAPALAAVAAAGRRQLARAVLGTARLEAKRVGARTAELSGNLPIAWPRLGPPGRTVKSTAVSAAVGLLVAGGTEGTGHGHAGAGRDSESPTVVVSANPVLSHDQQLPDGEEARALELREDWLSKLAGPETDPAWIRRCRWRYPLSTSLFTNGSRVAANHD